MSDVVTKEVDLRSPVERAENALYDSLDRHGATKRTMYLISALIDAKIAEALEALRGIEMPNE